MAAGDFIQRVAVQIAAQRMWADGRNYRELKKPIAASMAGMMEQNVSFVPIMKGSVCVGVEAIYLKSCNDTVTDTSLSENNLSDCDVTGVEAETAKKTYTPNISLTKAIRVSEDDCAGFTSFEEKLAFMKLQAKAAIESEYNEKYIAAIAANVQANAFVVGGTANGSIVEFPATDFEGGAGAKLMPKFHISAEQNQIYDAWMLNGQNFYEAHWLYEYKEKAGSDDRYDDVYMQGPYKMYWDIINVDSVVGSNPTFVIDKSAIGFFGQNEYSNDTPRELKSDLWTYREPSMRLRYRDGQSTQTVYFDVVEQHSCTVTSKDPARQRRHRVVDLEYTLKGGIITGPPDCGGGTGILQFDQPQS